MARKSLKDQRPEELRRRAEAMESEILARTEELAEANRLLREANAELTRRQAEERQRLTNDLERYAAELDAVMENLPDGVYIGTDAGMVRCNRRGLEMLGLNTVEELNLARSKPEVLRARVNKTGQPLAPDRRPFTRALRGETVVEEVMVRNVKTGADIVVRNAACPIRHAGEIVGAVTISTDITEQKHTEAVLSDNEEFTRAILSTAADAIITIDEKGMIHSANAAAERLFGYTLAEMEGQNVNRLMPDPFHTEHAGYIANYCKTGEAKIIGIGREVIGLRKDGQTFPMHLSVSEVRLRERRLFAGIVHDLSERRQLERQILEAASDEQRRIGHDLHDGLCQDLVGIAFGISAVGRELKPTEKEARATLDQLAASVRAAAGLARNLAHGLNPVDIKAGGLPAALRELAGKVSRTFNIACDFEWDGIAKVRDDATAIHLYRIVQEAVGNAVRHGKSNQVEIVLGGGAGVVELSISDNGIGMPEELKAEVMQGIAVSAGRRGAAGIGLRTMQYRTRVIGGTFAVLNGKQRGTVVSCTIDGEPKGAGEKLTARRRNRGLARKKRVI